MSNPNQILDEQLLSKLPEELRQEVKKRLIDVINYTPRIGVMGKSGAGKSSLINAIVGKQVCKTGGVGGCTRTFQEEVISMGNRSLIFMDLPGVAESQARNTEYTQLYQKKIADLDLILWVIKVDDRANKDDEAFYNWLTKQYKKEQILFVLSQCDKAEPSRSFDYKSFKPSLEQQHTINQNHLRISSDFSVPADDVVPVACDFYESKFDRWNIDALFTRIIQKIPSQAKSSLIAQVDKSVVTEKAKEEAKDDFSDTVENIIDVAIDYLPLPQPVKTVAKVAKKLIAEGAKKLWNFFFG
ncbi:putative small GTP-binding domain protein [Actinobacillus minor NM305]|uniref:Putative small GTP-binding domain protein n=1 Tax=Actinobacillus minor NM305 TaxID=637911 RepID=C5S5D0_9PAST|nr:GTPase [Actinobacillus minor]EER45886.1 putative small GTP-binding domain protein [Actinobacillus minor NM305]MDY5106305.1 GTPase [Actinobacillus minor]